MQDTPLEKRAQRRQRNKTMVDLNLVSLIDIFTILIFFLLANASDVEILPNTKAVKLPESTSEKVPKETVVVVVNDEDIFVQGRKVASVADDWKAISSSWKERSGWLNSRLPCASFSPSLLWITNRGMTLISGLTVVCA